MKQKILSIIIILFCSCMHAQNVIIPVEIKEDITSYNKYSGTAQGSVASDIMLKGEKFIEKGAPVSIKYQVQKRRGYGRPALITAQLISTVNLNGATIYLDGCEHRAEGKWRTGAALGCGLGLGLTIMPIVGFFFFCIKGSHVAIEEGSIIKCSVNLDNYR